MAATDGMKEHLSPPEEGEEQEENNEEDTRNGDGYGDLQSLQPEQQQDEDEDARFENALQHEDALCQAATNHYSSYKPQLMDEQEISELRKSIEQGQSRLHQEGHLRPFVPHKPTTSPGFHRRSHTTCLHPTRQRRLLTAREARSKPMRSIPPPSLEHQAPTFELHRVNRNQQPNQQVNQQQQKHDEPAACPPPVQKKRYAQVLGKEIRELRELQRRYDELKSSLVDHASIMCTAKAHDWPAFSEVYDRINELAVLMNQCE